MELRRIIAKRRKLKIKTFTCSKCRRPGNLILFKGKVCRKCWTPEYVDPRSYEDNLMPIAGPPVQLPETLELIDQLRGLMKKLKLPKYKLAWILCKDRCSTSSFFNWWAGSLQEQGQANMNARMRAALKELEEVTG